jgi:hypothetical protein
MPTSLQDFVITDGQRDIVSDADVQALRPGSRLVLLPAQGRPAVFKARAVRAARATCHSKGPPRAAQCAPDAFTTAGRLCMLQRLPWNTGRTLPACRPQERVSFQPHPKTLTMAGDYEYFAAQGHHPFAFALAELIDNALR